MAHFKDLPLMGGPDDPQERYKLHLPATFCCGLVFFDLNEEHQFSEAALAQLIAGVELRRFFGGIILRGQGHKKDATGKMFLTDFSELSEEEKRHFYKCQKCGEMVDMRQLDDVLFHEDHVQRPDIQYGGSKESKNEHAPLRSPTRKVRYGFDLISDVLPFGPIYFVRGSGCAQT
jgi:hypothetical protein